MLFAALLCFVGMEAKAQKDTTRQKRIIQEVISQQKTWQTKVYFLNKGKPMKIKESVIQQGTTLIIEVAWNPQLIKKVVFDTVVYRPTPQEIKDSKYTFTIKPKKKQRHTIIKYTTMTIKNY